MINNEKYPYHISSTCIENHFNFQSIYFTWNFIHTLIFNHLNLSREHALIQTDADAAAKLQKILETKEDFEKKDKINRDLFGRKGNNSYLCSVKGETR